MKSVTPGLILQGRNHTLNEIRSSDLSDLRIGFTVSKKVGNAVTRNRVKRRLKAVAQNILNEHNYMEFRRTSRKACRPDGSHGIYSPWCACFRRTYGKWDELYQKWLNDMKEMMMNNNKDIDQDIANYKFEKFHEDTSKFNNIVDGGDNNDEAKRNSHPHLQRCNSHRKIEKSKVELPGPSEI